MDDLDYCYRCNMSFRTERPEGAEGERTVCAEEGCERRFSHDSLGRVWLTDDQ